MEREKNLTTRKKSQNLPVTLARVFRLMDVMYKEMNKSKLSFSKSLSQSLVALLDDYKKQQSEPPPIPTVSVIKLQEELVLERAKNVQLMKGMDEISDIALNYKAEAVAERLENKRYNETLADLLPKKIIEAMNITNERSLSGRNLRVKQVLHSLKKPKKISANEKH